MTLQFPFLKWRGGSGGVILYLICTIVIVNALNSCLPGLYGEYYKPSYPDSSVSFEREWCGGSVGPFSVIKVPTPVGYLKVILRENIKNQLYIWIGFKNLGSSTLQFTSDAIRVSDLKKGAEWTITAKDFELFGNQKNFPHDSIINLDKVLPVSLENFTNDIATRIFFSIDDFSPQSVLVNLPPIIENSTKHQIQPLLLDTDKNGKTSKWHKKNTTIGQFKVNVWANSDFQGNTKVGSRHKATKFKGEIGIYFPAGKRWKFGSNKISFENAISGEMRQFYFPHLRVDPFTIVSFTTPFCCSSDASMHVPLIENEVRPRKLRVKIPPLLINGKTFIIKPITFELRRFDGGILPFNC